jgi:uncharacterized protein (TIRG00374 family)
VRRALTGPAGRAALSIGVIVAIFAGVLPEIADYSQAWQLIRAMTWPESVLVALAAAVNIVSYAPVWMAALPGLRLRQALMSDMASTTISNTVPVGFAFGVGTTAAMYHSFGFPAGAITRAIGLAGIWNNLVKLAMPALALAGVVLVGEVTAALAVAAVVGSVVLLLAIVALVLVLTHRRAAAVLASAAERVARAASRATGRPGPRGWVQRTDRFRADSLEILQHRWLYLSAAAVVSHVALFLVLLVCLRTVDGEGADAPWLLVLAVFTVTRLVTIVQITPGALGVAELSYVAGLTAVGVGADAAAGAVLLFRFLTWFVPIPLGAGAWLLWRRGAGRVPPVATTVRAAG